MKIALVSQAYYPVIGGVTEHVWHLGTELKQRGHDITVITGGGLVSDDRGLRVIRIGKQVPVVLNGAHVHVTIGFHMEQQFRAIEKREHFDLVHVQSPLDPFLPVAAIKAMRAPKVGTYHTYRENSPLFRIFPNYFRKVLAKVDENIAVSKSAASLVLKYYPETPFHIIPNGISLDRFSTSVAPIEKFRDGVFTILYVGRMDPRKGAKYLFAALPILEKQLPNFRILVVGSGWMKNVYDKYIPPKLLHRVEFVGYVTPEELPRYYRSADVYCSPATNGESFGLVLLEAMASGIPIVASDIVGYHDVVENKREGLLVPARSPRHLAEALITLARYPEKRGEMARNGLAKARGYSWEHVVNQIEPVYEKAISKNKSIKRTRPNVLGSTLSH